MRDHAVRCHEWCSAAPDLPGPGDEVDLAAARSRMALDVVDEILVEVRNPMPPGARRGCAGEWLGTRERAEGGHTAHVALSVTDEQRTAVLTGHPGIHREGVERIHERRDLLTETHVEANEPGQQHIAQHAERAESKMVVANDAGLYHQITAARCGRRNDRRTSRRTAPGAGRRGPAWRRPRRRGSPGALRRASGSGRATRAAEWRSARSSPAASRARRCPLAWRRSRRGRAARSSSRSEAAALGGDGCPGRPAAGASGC